MPIAPQLPDIVGHRGAAGLAPDNSAAAFEIALALGVDMLETDVRVTSDRRLVLFHDEMIALKSGSARTVASLTLADIRQSHPSVLTLDDLVEINGGRVPLMLDVKAPGYERELVAAITRHRLEQSAVVPSTWISTLRRLRAALPRLQLGLSTGHLAGGDPRKVTTQVIRKILAAGLPRMLRPVIAAAGLTDLMVYHRVATPRLISTAYRLGCRVNLWTIDDPTELRRALALNPSRVISNVPDLALRLRDELPPVNPLSP